MLMREEVIDSEEYVNGKLEEKYDMTINCMKDAVEVATVGDEKARKKKMNNTNIDNNQSKNEGTKMKSFMENRRTLKTQ